MSGPWEDFSPPADKEDGPWASFSAPAPNGANDELQTRLRAAGGGIEAAASLAAGMPAQIYSGLKGLHTLATTGDVVKAGQDVRDAQESNFGFGAYEPKSEYGKLGVQAVQESGGALTDLAGKGGRAIGGDLGETNARIAAEGLMNLAPIPGGKFVGKLGEGVRREFGRKPEPVTPTAAHAEAPPWETYSQEDFLDKSYAKAPESDAAQVEALQAALNRRGQATNGTTINMGVEGHVPPEAMDARQYADAQQTLNDRKVQMENDVAKQTSLDFNAAERARQEAAPVPGLERVKAAQRAEAEAPLNSWEGEGGQHGRIDIQAIEDGFKALFNGKEVGSLRSNLTPDQSKQLGENANVDMVKVDPEHRGTGVGSALYDAWDQAHEGRIAPSGKTSADAWAVWKRNYPEKVTDFVNQEAGRIKDGAPIRQVLENITDPEVKRSVIEASDGMANIKHRGAIDMQAVAEGLQHLTAGTRVLTKDGPGRVVGHTVTLIKNPDTIREHLNDIYDHATSVEDQMRLQDEFLKHDYDKIPHDKPVGAYTIQYPDGTMKRVFGEDISKVFQGLSAVPSKQLGALNAKDIHEALQNGMDKIGEVVNKVATTKVSPYTAKEQVAVNALGERNYIPKGDVPAKIIADALAEGKDGPSLWNNLQSGLMSAGDKVGSALMKGVARHFSYAEKVGENMIGAKVRPLERTLKALPKADLVATMEALKTGMLEGRDASGNLSPKAKAAHDAVRAAMDDALKLTNASLEALGRKPVTAKDNFMASMWSGNWHVPIKNAEGKLAWYIKAASKAEANRAIAHLQKNFPDLDLANAKPKYQGGGVGKKLPADVMGAYQEMSKFFTGEEAENIRQVMEHYTEAQGFKFQGHDNHLQPGKVNIRGFKGDEPWNSPRENALAQAQAQMEYLKDAMRWAPMQEALSKVKEVLSNKELADKQPNNMALTTAYTGQALGITQNMFKVPEQALQKFMSSLPVHVLPHNIAKFVGSLKMMTYLQQLGMSGGYMIATPLQAFLLAPARHLQLSGAGFDHNFLLTGAKALHDFSIGLISHEVKNTFNSKFRAPLTNLGKDAFKYMEENGIISQNVFHENSGLGEYAAVHTAKQLVGWTISMPEKIARAATFMSFAHHLDASGKFESRAELFRRAEELTNHTLTDFRRLSRPLAVEKFGQMGELGYTYKSPLFNQYNSLGEFARQAVVGTPTGKLVKGKDGVYTPETKKNAGPLLAALGMSAMLGGMTVMPFVNEADAAWNLVKDGVAKTWPNMYPAVSGLGVKGSIISAANQLSANDKVQQAIGQGPAKAIGDTLGYGGVSAATGSQMASRFSSSIGDISNPLGNVAPAAQEIKEWVGAAHGMTNPTSTNILQGVHTALAPPMVKGWMENYFDRFKTVKQTGGQGYANANKIEDRDTAYVRTPEEESKRNFGLTSLQEATTKSSRYIKNEEARRFNDAREASMTKMFDAVGRGDPEDIHKYAVSYFRNEGDEDKFNSDLDKKIDGLAFTPEQRAAIKAQTITALKSVVRMHQLQGH